MIEFRKWLEANVIDFPTEDMDWGILADALEDNPTQNNKIEFLRRVYAALRRAYGEFDNKGNKYLHHDRGVIRGFANQVGSNLNSISFAVQAVIWGLEGRVVRQKRDVPRLQSDMERFTQLIRDIPRRISDSGWWTPGDLLDAHARLLHTLDELRPIIKRVGPLL